MMDPITAAVLTKGIQGVGEVVDKVINSSNETEKSKSGGDFEGILRSLLTPDQANMVNEEELFAALIGERVQALKGDEAAAQYQELLGKHKSQMARGDGYVPVEDAANAALEELISGETITAEEGRRIKAESFAAAQLDDNHAALYDGRGGEGDPTIAVDSMESALLAARAMIEKFESGEAEPGEVPERSAPSNPTEGSAPSGGTTTPKGNSVDGPEGFVFKPESDHEHKLVVILPSSMAHDVSKVLLKDEDGNKIEEGRSSGYANGGREHFRFNKAGGQYPKNIEVEVSFQNGSVKTYKIPNPGERYD